MSDGVDVTALAVNVPIPEHLRWTDTRRGQEFVLLTLTVRMLPDGHLAVRAYGRPTAGGRGGYVSFPVRDTPELSGLVASAATRAGQMWSRHRGLTPAELRRLPADGFPPVVPAEARVRRSAAPGGPVAPDPAGR